MSASAVYGAEHQWSAVLDRGGLVDFHGSHIYVPLQKRFADVSSVQRYVDTVLALDSIREAFPNAGPVHVRERRLYESGLLVRTSMSLLSPRNPWVSW